MTLINNPYQTKLPPNTSKNKTTQSNTTSPLDILLNAAKTPTQPNPTAKETARRNRINRGKTDVLPSNSSYTRSSFQTPASDLVSKSRFNTRLRSQSTKEQGKSGYVQEVKKKEANAHVSYAHRNYEVNNKTPFNPFSTTNNTKERSSAKPAFSHKNPFIHDVVYPSDISRNINNFIPQLNTQKTNAEKLRNINAKCEFLHSLYARQRNHYINTYKANNDLISEAFATIKSLKDELAFALTHCKCRKGCGEQMQQANANINSEDYFEDTQAESIDGNDLEVNLDVVNDLEGENEQVENIKKVKLGSENKINEPIIEETSK